MEHSRDIADAVRALIKLMVDHPERVIVESAPMNDGSSLRISVDPADIGKVIGKQGRTARSLRVIVTAMGMATKQRISLDIQD
ncbi:MAG: KH domain-containing protein [Acidobacteriota bacterium]|nr:KH domain-containing protein [Acidobacteriota bacterium]